MRMSALLAICFASFASGCDLLDDDYGYEDTYVRADDEIITPDWAERSPTAADIRRAYPQDALDQNIGARVILLCRVMPNRALTCEVETDERPGYGFGEAAISVAGLFRAKPAAPGASTAPGQLVRVPVRFAPG